MPKNPSDEEVKAVAEVEIMCASDEDGHEHYVLLRLQGYLEGTDSVVGIESPLQASEACQLADALREVAEAVVATVPTGTVH